jgi:gliding motility-associated-like protein
MITMQKSISITITTLLLCAGFTFGQTASPLTYSVDNTVKSDKKIQFSANAPSGAWNFIWDFNNGQHTSTAKNPIVSNNEIGNSAFEVKLTYSLNGERVSTSANIDIEKVSKTILHPNKADVIEVRAELLDFADLPNVFTPNGDSSNDFYIVEVTEPTEISFKVFSRSGMLVYEKVAGLIHWDGKNYYGQDLPDGIYYYVIKDTEGLYNPATGFFYIYR